MIRNLIQQLVYKTSTFVILTALVLAGLSLNLAVSHADNLSITGRTNCDSNAVLYCGAKSISSLIDKYTNGDGVNSAASIQHIYSYFNISGSDIRNMNSTTAEEKVVVGKVDKNGDVYDSNNKLVARGAMTAGRQNIAGSTQRSVDGTTFYTRPPSVSFAENSLPAYVVMDNGKFVFAILSSCGNPIMATAIVPVEKPKPVPAKPTTTATTTTNTTMQATSVCSGNIDNIDNGAVATQGGNCSQNTTIVEQTNSPPAPSGQCTGLTIDVISTSPLEISVTPNNNLSNGATVSSSSLDFGDGSPATTTDQSSVNHTYQGYGSYTITATENYSASSSIASSSCQAQFTSNAPAPTPTIVTASTPPVASTTASSSNLVNTGPGDVLALFSSVSLVSFFAYRMFLKRHLPN
ncbi:MAG TPA: hypothetical protein VFN31_03520 [Candidatus Saccharimonadales bacterium]|nr:hypothetical protein [Candidatus Saccharimonadales bacterium]